MSIVAWQHRYWHPQVARSCLPSSKTSIYLSTLSFQVLKSGSRWNEKPELEKLLDILMEFNYNEYGMNSMMILRDSSLIDTVRLSIHTDKFTVHDHPAIYQLCFYFSLQEQLEAVLNSELIRGIYQLTYSGFFKRLMVRLSVCTVT